MSEDKDEVHANDVATQVADVKKQELFGGAVPLGGNSPGKLPPSLEGNKTAKKVEKTAVAPTPIGKKSK